MIMELATTGLIGRNISVEWLVVLWPATSLTMGFDFHSILIIVSLPLCKHLGGGCDHLGDLAGPWHIVMEEWPSNSYPSLQLHQHLDPHAFPAVHLKLPPDISPRSGHLLTKQKEEKINR